MRHELFPAASLAPGEFRSLTVGRVDVVVVRKPDGSFSALRDRCSHRGATLSLGQLVQHTDSDGFGEFHLTDRYVLQCPWHGFQFDVDTGSCVADPRGERVKRYEVSVEDGTVVLTL